MMKIGMKTKFIGLITIGILVTILMFLNHSPKQFNQTINFKEIKFNAQDRILILAPHPDDEVLGCGGVIQKAKSMDLPVKVVFLTYGDQNEWSFILYRKRPVIMPKEVQQMGLVRHDEAIDADKVLGLSPEQLIFLGYPDFRTLAIWYAHWRDRPPARSILTDVRAVPYANAFRPGTPYKADEILKDLKNIISDFKPTKIFLSHPADQNPDHQSLYLFTRVALWDLKSELKAEIYPYLIHFKNWPKPAGYLPDSHLIPPDILAQKIAWEILSLDNKEITTNDEAIKKHRSQYEERTKYLLSFIRTNELFGDFTIITLNTNKAFVPIASNRSEYLKELPEELLNEERANFVGIEEEFLSLEDNNLVFTLKLSRPLGETTGISLYLFGYRSNKNFADMPKIHIKFGAIDHKVLDQDKVLSLDSIYVDRKAKEITIRIPLDVLDNPEHILTSARTYIGDVPLDWVGWRVLELSN
jgi:LmbE family N-acetylglucosaminyl deacetylase